MGALCQCWGHSEQSPIGGMNIRLVGITPPSTSCLNEPGRQAGSCCCCGSPNPQAVAAVPSCLLWSEASGQEQGSNGICQGMPCEVLACRKSEEGSISTVVPGGSEEGFHGLHWAGGCPGSCHHDRCCGPVRVSLGALDEN